jgi:hypothetical protein
LRYSAAKNRLKLRQFFVGWWLLPPFLAGIIVESRGADGMVGSLEDLPGCSKGHLAIVRILNTVVYFFK